MKRQNRILLALSTFSLITAALVGCGGDKSESKKVVVTFGHTFGDKVESAIEAKIKDFKRLVKENEGVDVDVQLQYLGGYNDVFNKINTYFADGTLPTMTVAYPDAVADFIHTFGKKYVVNFDDYINDEKLTFGTDTYLGDTEDVNDFVENFLNEGRQFTIPGTYSIPFLKSTEVMIYNLDAATEAMRYYDPDVVTEGRVKERIAAFSWNELMDFADVAYKHKSDVSSTLEYPVYYDSDSNMFITHMYQSDYDYSSVQNGKGHIDFDDGVGGPNYQGAISLLNEYKKLHDDHLLTTKGTVGTYASDYFKKGKTIFSIGSSGGGGYSFPDAGEFNSEVCVAPCKNNTPYYICQGASIAFLRNPTYSNAKNDRNLLYAWKFLKYITSKNVNTFICLKGSEGYVPVRQSCYQSEAYFDFIEQGDNYAKLSIVVTDDINGRYINNAVFTGSASLRTAVGSAVTQLLTGQVGTAKAAIDAAINEAQKNIV